jgi:hypothetical protein
MLLVLAQPAHAQDATVLVVALAPPILVAPVCLAFARWFWLRRESHSPARIVPLLVVSCIEVLLWVAFSASAVVIMTGDWNIRALLWPVVACGALWILSRTWYDPSQRAARWLFFASPPLVLLLLAAATWLVLIAAWR